MSNKRITDLTELTNPTTDDVFPVVDIASNTTTKVQLGNLPVPTSVTTALATKQDTLVSGTNIKTLNSTSLLGNGNIVLTANPSGVAGAIQFSNGSAFASDAANFFWDNINKRLGIGTDSPTQVLDLVRSSGQGAIRFFNTANSINTIQSGATFRIFNSTAGTPAASVGFFQNLNNQIGINTNNPIASLTVQGSGSTSATTSLLVQNSAGSNALLVRDDLITLFFGAINLGNGNTIISQQSGNLRFEAVNSITSDIRINPFRQVNINNGNTYTAQASAILQVDSTTKGFLPPVMTTTQKNAIATPAAGLVVYDNTTNKLCCYNGSTWNDLF